MFIIGLNRAKGEKIPKGHFYSNVMKLTWNLKARSRSVACATPYNIKYIIMKAIILSEATQTGKTPVSRRKNREIPYTLRREKL